MTHIGLALFTLTALALLVLGRQRAREPKHSESNSISLSANAENIPQIWMPVIVTLILLGASLYVILSKRYDDAVQKWAFGAVGMIIGFWFKSPQQ